jgi:pimeloyl-ACP methyl ester carboxylesterase
MQTIFYGAAMINLNVIPSSPLLFALEPFHALCDYVAGQAQRLDPSLHGDGHPVLVFPGLGASGTATADLRMRLRQLGYAVYDWEQGINNGPGIDFDRWLLLLGEHLLEIYSQHNRSVSIIGWSLGGMYARELAKEHPNLVRQVITLATPFGKPDFSITEKIFGELGSYSCLLDDARLQRLSEAPPVPSSSVYSQTDGIVGWQRCVGKESGDHYNIEVKGVSHFGMVYHPEVLNVVADLLKNRNPIADIAVRP